MPPKRSSRTVSTSTTQASASTIQASVSTRPIAASSPLVLASNREPTAATSQASVSTTPVAVPTKPPSAPAATRRQAVTSVRPAPAPSTPAAASSRARVVLPRDPAVPEPEGPRRSNRNTGGGKPVRMIPEHLRQFNGQFGPIMWMNYPDIFTSVNPKDNLRDWHRFLLMMGTSAHGRKREIRCYEELKHLGKYITDAYLRRHNTLGQKVDFFAGSFAMRIFFEKVLKKKTTVRALIGDKWKAVPNVYGLSLNRSPFAWLEVHAGVWWQTIGEELTSEICCRGEGQLPVSTCPTDPDKVDFIFYLKEFFEDGRPCYILRIEIKPGVVTTKKEGFYNAATVDLTSPAQMHVVFDQVLNRGDHGRRDRLTKFGSMYAIVGVGFGGMCIEMELKVDEHGKLVSLPDGQLVMKDIYYYEDTTAAATPTTTAAETAAKTAARTAATTTKTTPATSTVAATAAMSAAASTATPARTKAFATTTATKTFQKTSFLKDVRPHPDGSHTMKNNKGLPWEKFVFMPFDEGHDLFRFFKEEIKKTCEKPLEFAPIPKAAKPV